MPALVSLALLLGYLVCAGLALAFLPARSVEPLYVPMALTTVVALVATLVVLIARWREQRLLAARPDMTLAAPAIDAAVGLEPEVVAALASPDVAAAPPDEPATDLVPAPPAEEPAADDRQGQKPRLFDVRADVGPIAAQDLRHALYEGRVEARLHGLATPTPERFKFILAAPRLRGRDGVLIGPDRYHAVAARCGLIGLIDRILILRAAQHLRRAAAVGKDVRLVCRIDATSLSDPGFVTEIESFAGDSPELAIWLILEVDRARLDRSAERGMARLRDRGLHFCLRAFGARMLDPVALWERGFGFVNLRIPAPEPVDWKADLVQLEGGYRAVGVSLLVDRPGAGPVPMIEGPRSLPAAAGAQSAA